jgi:hypothetical protein
MSGQFDGAAALAAMGAAAASMQVDTIVASAARRE